MKPYLVTCKFYYNGELHRERSYTILSNEPLSVELSGEDFDSLWRFCYRQPRDTYFELWELKSGKRFIQDYDTFISCITSKNCKPWKYVVSSSEITISMEDLMQFNSEDVIQYLKERGMTTCPMKF